ncbi:hypothetical protein [Pseudomonas sp. HS6]|uniref:hypothetical protein n=1 Tax=Pseudomonas sp. HS6 TaxID=2850559 RepID=UPI00201948DD|nr:hypothetical protein [Pseudomonas sp. HS6]UQS12770.1 hypothetical protein JJN09_16190 [Pseudomonas sp. HS6]
MPNSNTTTGTGTVASVNDVSKFNRFTGAIDLIYAIGITPDDGGVTLTVETHTSPEVGVGDKVSYKVARSNAGTFVTEVTKIA